MGQIKVPASLYHYCSLETFLSIARNKEIWLTDLLQSNDYLEGAWLYSLTESLLENYCKPNNQDEPELAQAKQKLNKEIKQYIGTSKQKQLNNIFYGFCLSEKKDLLSQWRGYADDGQGVSIGFSSRFFVELSKARREEAILDFQPVVYDLQSQTQFIFNELSKHSIRRASLQAAGQLADAHVEFAIDKSAIFFKNSAFSEEKEWRLVYRDLRTDTKNPNQASMFNGGDISERRWYARSSRIIPYHALNFSKNLVVIQSITLGPKCLARPADISLYLQDNGYDPKKIDVNPSIASYR